MLTKHPQKQREVNLHYVATLLFLNPAYLLQFPAKVCTLHTCVRQGYRGNGHQVSKLKASTAAVGIVHTCIPKELFITVNGIGKTQVALNIYVYILC